MNMQELMDAVENMRQNAQPVRYNPTAKVPAQRDDATIYEGVISIGDLIKKHFGANPDTALALRSLAYLLEQNVPDMTGKSLDQLVEDVRSEAMAFIAKAREDQRLNMTGANGCTNS